LKIKNLPTSKAIQLTEDIDVVDGMVKQLSDRVDLASYVVAIFSSGVRNKWKAVKMQSELEDLANNKLFNAAAKLQTV
jgi:hypothetical protein